MCFWNQGLIIVTGEIFSPVLTSDRSLAQFEPMIGPDAVPKNSGTQSHCLMIEVMTP